MCKQFSLKSIFLILLVSNSGFAQNLDYPILFVHGISSSPEKTWLNAGVADYLENTLNLGNYEILNACLNADGDQSTSSMANDIAYFFSPFTVENVNYYFLNFDIDPDGSNQYHNTVKSNQAAIVKQGAAIGYAIESILAATGKDKVYLVGHSMGGLAAREYVQNSIHWQADGQHHVAEVITIGSPNWGSNVTDFLPIKLYFFGNLEVDPQSEAIRDMRYHYNDGVGSFPPTAAVDTAAYLFGGSESEIPSGGYHNSDMNCDGDNNSPQTLLGLNDLSTFPPDVEFYWYRGKHSGLTAIYGHESDGIVRFDRQEVLNFGISRTIEGEVYHSAAIAAIPILPPNPQNYETQKFKQYLQPIFYIVEANITADAIWSLDNSPYIITEEVTITNGTLTIEPGVEVYFLSGTGLRIATGSSPGALQANGTPSNPILFTSNSGLNNDWRGILFDDRSDQSGYSSTLTNCIIEKAGQINAYGVPAEVYFNRTNGVTISQSTIGLAVTEANRGAYSVYCTESSPTLSNTMINNSGGNAVIYLSNNSSPGVNNNSIVASSNPYWIFADQNNCSPNISGNIFTGTVTNSIRVGPNATINGNTFSGAFTPGMEIIAGQMTVSRTWSKQNGDSVYVVVAGGSQSNLHVYQDNAYPILTLNPGIVVKFAGTGIRIASTESCCYTYRPGGLVVNGTSSAPVLLTSFSGSSGGWRGIIFDGNSDYNISSSLSYCTIENAGQTNSYGVPAALYFNQTSNAVTLSNSTVVGSSGHSVYLNQSATSFAQGEISQNSGNDVIYLTSSSINLSQNTITSNFSGVDAVVKFENGSGGTLSSNTIYSAGGDYWVKSVDNGSNPSITGNSFSGTVNKPLRVGPTGVISGNTLSGNFTPGMEILAGQMTVSRTWSKQNGDSVYVVVAGGSQSNLHVYQDNAYPILTLNPGIVVKFAGTGIRIASTESCCYTYRPGGLVVNGTSSAPVLLTSFSGSSGGWRGIIFDGNSDYNISSSLSYCTIENAGQTNSYGVPAALYFNQTSNAVTLSNSTVVGSSGHSVYLNQSATSFAQGEISQNSGNDVIYLTSSSINLSQNTITSNFSGVDAVVKFENGSGGTLSSNTIYSAGGDYWVKSVDNGSNPSITGNSFSGTVNKPLRVGPTGVISGNTLSGNFTPGMEILTGQMTVSRTWSKQNGDSVYVVVAGGSQSNLHVYQDNAYPILTLNPGIVVKFAGAGIRIASTESCCYTYRPGGLVVNGTSSAPVLLTSFSGSSGGWRGIIFDGNSDYNISSSLSYCTIENAGQTNSYGVAAAVYFYQTNTVFINDCIIKNNGGHGLHINISSPNIGSSQVTNNGLYGIFMEGSSNPSIGNSLHTGNNIYNNGAFDLYNNSSNNINARYNYWGSIDADIIESRIYHKPDNNTVGAVYYNPWVNENHDLIYPPNTSPTQPIVFYPDNGSVVMLSDYLVWTESYDPYDVVYYHIQVDDDSNFASPAIDAFGLTAQMNAHLEESKLSELLISPGVNAVAMRLDSIPGHQNLVDNTTYFWQVEAIDDSDSASGFAPGQHYFFFNIDHVPECLVVAPDSLVFGNSTIGESASDTVIARNICIRNLKVGPILITGPDAASFNIDTTSFIMGPSEGKKLEVSFIPDAIKRFSATLEIQSEDGIAMVALSGSGVQKPEWLAPISVRNVSNQNQIFDLYFGGHPDATDGFDTGLDSFTAPSGFNYYAYFAINDVPSYLDTDIRGWVSPFETEINWILNVVNADDITSGITWHANELPLQGSIRLKEPQHGINIDMRQHSSVQFTGNGRLLIEYKHEICTTFDFPITNGAWYLISLPVVPQDNAVASLFPEALGAFAWNFENSNYVQANSLEAGRAYWLLLLQAATVEVCGQPFNSYTTNYTALGWDMIGAVQESNEVVDDPGGSVIAMFGWNPAAQSYMQINSYAAEPQQGYWILVFDTPSTVTVGSGSASSKGQMAKASMPADLAAFYQLYGALPPPPPSSAGSEQLPAIIIPTEFGLSQNYPNPFNPETAIEYQLPAAGHVSLKVYTILGREVRTLIDSEQPAGFHRVRWEGKDDAGHKLNSGVYLYRLRAGEFMQIRKLVLLR